ncbi:MAG: hypothetical protein H0V33_12815 [Acidimicrobiia bacterium]|jgi:hypothetical protein|nr:hypothetical protein [Acidimicrobiia bacterium]
MTGEKITRDDLEAKFRELKGETDETAASAQSYLLGAAVVVGAIVLLAVFTLGRRKGKKRTTVVEIRRV